MRSIIFKNGKTVFRKLGFFYNASIYVVKFELQVLVVQFQLQPPRRIAA